MNPRIKSNWLKALRSGEYKQTTQRLKDKDQFCCLGVLCDLHSKETNTCWTGSEYTKYLEEDSILPQVVIDWAELPDCNPNILDNKLKERTGPQPVGYFNDYGRTFEEIANLIEEQY